VRLASGEAGGRELGAGEVGAQLWPRSIAAMSAVVLAFLASGATEARSQAVDTAAASAALATFDANCRAVGETLWGRSLCGPVVLVHAPTRAALASRPDPGGSFVPVAGLYAGRLPDGLPTANTAVEWAGERWTMALLPLPSDIRASYTLLAHEAFHRAQPELGLAGRDAASPHLDDEAGRVWLRLEVRALALALESRDEAAARAAARDAVVFRTHRHALFPGADTLEAMLELHEGLAEYSGVRYAAMLLGEDPDWTARATRLFEGRRSFVRSFAYATGPALGLLLDRFDPGWRTRAGEAGIAEMLAAAVGGAPVLVDQADPLRRARAYGHGAVAEEEAERAHRLAARLADIRARLVDGPVLLLEQSNLNAMFNPNELVPMAGAGTYYPTGSFRAEWGSVEVTEGGALVSPDWTELRLPATGLRVEGGTVRGAGWTLELADGWSVRPRAGGWEASR
jgi:hypothetical protein